MALTFKDLQIKLENKNFSVGPLGPDGVWGNDSAKAIEAWARSRVDLDAPMVPSVPGNLIPPMWLSDCRMERVIMHWTAGGWKASVVDREHYHIIIEDDGRLVRGDNAIIANVSAGDGDYAAHTRGCNTGSIGVAVAAMSGAVERPFNGGPFPMTEKQWTVMARVVAELCKFYGIPVSARTVLSHGEVQRTLGIAQAGKWDINVLPWKPTLSSTEVNNLFRAKVVEAI